ncbi:hypothetical protein Y032_0105g3668 [Ancylostoma ceylanicum]|uniref:SCP domain-containing protein n=1 Tax=Ancylostoma ceylanicum TaxID=53326 RepID=A0A016TGD1_9BILA|nr:hypothetical protein Y032_0105g3668 [Ancylostoma ceylanicum]
MVLQNYKCELEKSAYAAAQNCAKEGSTTPGVDEVWHVIDSSMSDMKAAAEQAITTWFSQITTKGNYMMQKTGQQNILMRTPDIANFAKMVWDSHTDVGCAIVKCNAATKVVCHYSPAKFTYGSPIYVMGGTTCRQCPNVGGTCLTAEGLCVKSP